MSLIRGVLAGVAIAVLLWQNHVVCERMTQLAEQVEAVAAPTITVPIVPTLAGPVYAAAPAPTLASEKKQTSPAVDERAVAAERHATDVISSGRLTPENILELRADLAGLTRADAFEIRRRIADAINAEQLVPTQLPFDLP